MANVRRSRWVRRALLGAVALSALLGGGGAALGLLVSRAPGQSHRGPLPPLTPAQREAAVRLKADVRHLSERIGPRHLGAPESMRAAVEYTAGRLGQAGLTPQRLPFDAAGQRPVNLVADHVGQRYPDLWIVVGAHYDTVDGTPGADDNASGVAALLELASRLARRPLARSVRFAAFANEEPPYFWTDEMGSLALARQMRDEGRLIEAMISFDMLGYFDASPGTQRYPAPLSYFYPTTADFIAFVGEWRARPLIWRAVERFRGAVAFPSEAIAAPGSLFREVNFSDNWSFAQIDVPSLMVTDTAFGRNAHYHRPTDTWDTLDYERMARVVDGLEAVIVDLAGLAPEPASGEPPSRGPDAER